MKRNCIHGEVKKKKILALLADGPMSANQIAAEIHLSGAGVLKHMKAMRGEVPKRAYIDSYAINGTGRPTPIYAAGSLDDAVYDHQFVLKNHHHKLLGLVLAELENSPRTVRELSILTGLSVSGVRNLITELREMGWCYLSGWSPVHNRNRAPIFSAGIGKDVKLKPMTRAQRWKQEKSDEEQHSRKLAKRRAKAMSERSVKKPVSWITALGL